MWRPFHTRPSWSQQLQSLAVGKFVWWSTPDTTCRHGHAAGTAAAVWWGAAGKGSARPHKQTCKACFYRRKWRKASPLSSCLFWAFLSKKTTWWRHLGTKLNFLLPAPPTDITSVGRAAGAEGLRLGLCVPLVPGTAFLPPGGAETWVGAGQARLLSCWRSYGSFQMLPFFASLFLSVESGMLPAGNFCEVVLNWCCRMKIV